MLRVSGEQDVAVVLSGGGMSAMMLELGFLRRLRESVLWPRVAVVFGTSAGALGGCMAVLDRLDDLDEFLLELQPNDAFRANQLWRLPLLGTHDYVLPQTIADRLGDPRAIAEELAEAAVELVVVVTDLTSEDAEPGTRLFERAYSSKETEPGVMAEAVLASAAVSALVLPMMVGDRIATDGGWVRNFPLGYAYERPEVEQIVAFRYEPRFPTMGAGALGRAAARLRRVSRLPPARALVAELEEAVERGERGQPTHIVDIFSRLSRVAIIRNTVLEEMVADFRERSLAELRALERDVRALVAHDPAVATAVEDRFRSARFPYGHDRLIPRITVTAGAGVDTPDPGFRNPKPWTAEVKARLRDEAYALTDAALREHGFS